MKKKNNVIKKIVCILLFILLLPVILLVILIKSIAKHSRYKIYKKNRVSGRTLIVSTDIDELEKMQDFELEDFFKYFFFYQGYTVKDKALNTSGYNFILEADGNVFMLKYSTRRKVNQMKQISRLATCMSGKKILNGIYVTVSNLSDETLEYASSHGIVVFEKTRIQKELLRIKERLALDSAISGYDANKPMEELIDQMYPNRI